MKSRGFTLIELMIVIAIIAVLAAIGFPGYKDYMHKTRRSDAKTALLELQTLQEKLRGNCDVYGQQLNKNLVDADSNVISFECDAGAPATTSLRISAKSSREWYDLTVTGASATGYVATATAAAGGSQASDSNCKKLILTVSPSVPNGAKTSLNASDADSTGCW